MATSYPGGVDTSFSTHTDAGDAILALENALGTYPSPFPTPGDLALLGMTMSPVGIPSGGSAATISGRQYFSRLRLPTATITNVLFGVRTAGATFSNTNSIALFTDAGSKVAETADLATVINTTGFKTAAFASPYSATAGYYYLGFLSNATTAPQLAGYTGDGTVNLLANMGASSSTRPCYTDATTRTAWLTSYTYSSLTATNTTIWMGLT